MQKNINAFTWLIAIFFLMTISLNTVFAKRKDRNAENKKDAIAWCNSFSKKEHVKCGVEKCPCGIGKRKVKKVKRKNSTGYCVCVSKAAKKDLNKERAQAACKEYTKKYGKSCIVKQGNCPISRMPIAKYRGGALIKYSACREKFGAERLKKAANVATMARPTSQFLVGSYSALFARIKAKSSNRSKLPRATQKALQKHFPAVNLSGVTIAHSSSKAVKGCITDCKKIYCRRASTITKFQNGTISRLLVHEIGHTEQCSKWGGRNRYALHWFRHLPVGVVKGIKKGEDKYVERLHDKMPMESSAESKAQRVCRAVTGCVFD